MNQNDNKTPQPDQSSQERAALLRNWVGGDQAPGKNDKFLAGQMPAKPCGPEPTMEELVRQVSGLMRAGVREDLRDSAPAPSATSPAGNQSSSNDDVETEEKDGLRLGRLRLLQARHRSLALTGRIPKSLQLPTSTPATTASNSSARPSTSR